MQPVYTIGCASGSVCSFSRVPPTKTVRSELRRQCVPPGARGGNPIAVGIRLGSERSRPTDLN
jgi:hypothetical protein